MVIGLAVRGRIEETPRSRRIWAAKDTRGRIVPVREGGYHLEGLARSVAAQVAALMGA